MKVFVMSVFAQNDSASLARKGGLAFIGGRSGTSAEQNMATYSVICLISGFIQNPAWSSSPFPLMNLKLQSR